jgi:hypothetical protein
MGTSPNTPTTEFTLDVMGRYVCNGLDEALRSTDKTVHPDARPFDKIIIGGGTFGAVLANHLFNRDKTHAHRILVLEAGPIVLPEHAQNLPMLNTGEIWGVPWNSDSPKTWNREFPGLAYAVGGRSLFWGGWSPYFIESELPSPPWPAGVKSDLTQKTPENGNEPYLDQAARQLGTVTTNDFIHGSLHFALRDRLFAGLQYLPPNPNLTLAGNRGTLMTANRPEEELKHELEAPLAVQSSIERAGFFPFNKFSAVPLLIRAARMAQIEAEQSATGSLDEKNVKKRLMVVDNVHVIRLERIGRRITRIITNQGTIDVPQGGDVFIALGTIENTRMALNTLPNVRGLIGRNLMAHLRSNLTIRIKRSSLSGALDNELQVSALFVKGISKHADGTLGHFHVQITASGVGQLGMDSEAELFKKVPDIDGLDQFRGLTDEWIVLTLRGIGEMIGDKASADPLNRITLGGPQDNYDYGTPRALVRLEAGPAGSKDLALWDAMDKACDQLAVVFANGSPIQYLSSQGGGVWQVTPPAADARRDKLSSTHHEGGTLWMGDDPATSVTNEFGRFHESDNLYALGPALLPTMGSPNPLLSGIALARRTADRLLRPPQPTPVEPQFEPLFDGTEKTFKSWQTVGPGAFALIDGQIVAQTGGDLGLLYYAPRTFGDFVLRLQFRLDRLDDNSGIFVRFRDPRRAVPDRNNPSISYPYDNQAWVAVDTGFEVQIDELARGDASKGIPDGLDKHRTGAIYNIPIGLGEDAQIYRRGPVLQAGEWNDLEIRVTGNNYTVRLNGQQTTTFTNADTFRGRSPERDIHSGYVGLQAHTGRVAFRNIRVLAAIATAPAVTAREDVAILSDSEALAALSEEERMQADIQPRERKKGATPRKQPA